MNDITIAVETMSSQELLELLSFESKSSLHLAIRKMFAKEIDDLIIKSSLDSRGYVVDYHLPEIETHMFVAKYDHTHLRRM